MTAIGLGSERQPPSTPMERAVSLGKSRVRKAALAVSIALVVAGAIALTSTAVLGLGAASDVPSGSSSDRTVTSGQLGGASWVLRTFRSPTGEDCVGVAGSTAMGVMCPEDWAEMAAETRREKLPATITGLGVHAAPGAPDTAIVGFLVVVYAPPDVESVEVTYDSAGSRELRDGVTHEIHGTKLRIFTDTITGGEAPTLLRVEGR